MFGWENLECSPSGEPVKGYLVSARSLTWRKVHGSLSGLGTRQARIRRDWEKLSKEWSYWIYEGPLK